MRHGLPKMESHGDSNFSLLSVLGHTRALKPLTLLTGPILSASCILPIIPSASVSVVKNCRPLSHKEFETVVAIQIASVNRDELNYKVAGFLKD